jgi:hypothetical protein
MRFRGGAVEDDVEKPVDGDLSTRVVVNFVAEIVKSRWPHYTDPRPWPGALAASRTALWRGQWISWRMGGGPPSSMAIDLIQGPRLVPDDLHTSLLVYQQKGKG